MRPSKLCALLHIIADPRARSFAVLPGNLTSNSPHYARRIPYSPPCPHRSPKDSKCSVEKCKRTLQEELGSEDEATIKEELRENRKLIALLKASLQGLYVESGKEALDLLVTSARIHVCISYT